MHGHGPVMVKNPFPEDFAFASPAPSSMSRRSIKNEKEEKDILDDFVVDDKLKQQAPAWKSKRQTINEMEAVSTQQEAFKASVEESVPKPQANMERTAQAAIPSMIDEPKYIPTLPSGRRLNFNVLETWGDMNYLGLTGIEIFDQNGSQLQIEDSYISAFPPDVNVLPGYGTDPRTVEKLVDGNYFTNDDFHVWLTPFTQGEDHTITINMGKET